MENDVESNYQYPLLSGSHWKEYEKLKKISRNNKIFRRPRKNCDAFSEFENILISNEDWSAVISLIFRKFQDENFLTKTVGIKAVMKYFAEEEDVNVKNLLTILIFDWHDPKENSEYFMIKKFRAYEASGKNLFQKLFSILDDKNNVNPYLHHVCLRVIYVYFDECFNNSENEEIKIESEYIQNLIIMVLNMRNTEYKMKILKILVVYMENTKDENYKTIKNQVLKATEFNYKYISIAKVSYNSIVLHCDAQFFKLLFILKDNRVLTFKTEFDRFVETHMKLFGDFWKHAIKLNAQLLYHLAEMQGLRETAEHLLIKTTIFEIRHPIMQTLRIYDEFNVVFNEPLPKEDQKQLVMLFSNMT